MPKRIQRRRVKAWRMPEGAVYVGRPSRWGNPFRLGTWSKVIEWKHEDGTREHVDVGRYRVWITDPKVGIAVAARRELKGKDLACWCGLDEPCHADVLLEIANQ